MSGLDPELELIVEHFAEKLVRRRSRTRDRGPAAAKVAAHLLAHLEHLRPGHSNAVHAAVGGRRSDVLWALAAIREAAEPLPGLASPQRPVPAPGYHPSERGKS